MVGRALTTRSFAALFLVQCHRQQPLLPQQNLTHQAKNANPHDWCNVYAPDRLNQLSGGRQKWLRRNCNDIKGKSRQVNLWVPCQDDPKDEEKGH